MTLASMRRVLQGLISGSLLSSGQRQQMDRNCLGWDCSITSQAGYRGKGGGPFCDGSACLQIFFGILAGTIPVVVATNSDPGKPLFAIVQTALRPPPATGNRHAGDPAGQMKTKGKLTARPAPPGEPSQPEHAVLCTTGPSSMPPTARA